MPWLGSSRHGPPVNGDGRRTAPFLARGIGHACRRRPTRAPTRPMAAVQAAISARRVTPSLARMCSTCALAVFGAIVEPLGDLARSSAPRRSAGRPRTRGRSAAATAPRSTPRPRPDRGRARRPARAAGSLPSASAVARTPRGAWPPRRTRFDAEQALGEVEPRPGGLPDPAALRPSRGPPRSRHSRAAASEPAGEPDQPVGVGEGRARRSRPSRRGAPATRRASARPRPGRCAASRRAYAGHDERDEERPLAGRASAIARPSSQRATAPSASPATRSVSARPQSGGRMNWTSPIVRPDGERVVEPAPRLVELAAAERDEADHVERADAPAPAAALDELLARACRRPRPSVRRPSRSAPTSSPSSGGSATARSRRRTASPSPIASSAAGASMTRAAMIAMLR